ncbi:site-specific integrase [Thiobacillus sp.]|jgi:integrase|uniref:tyrosine-type recombinase/integrase n=1 Tax=Thiobacillus sp. TaxID=924 RepID=UPI0025EE2349|nr:site-specific integrase [Thiobacillus sp.]
MAEKLNFTKAAIEALPIPTSGQRAEYIDTKQPSLRLRVTSSSVKSFCVLKRIRGARMERITLGRHPEMTIEQARKKTAELLGKIAEGNNPADARRALKAELTFADLFVEYGERHGQKKLAWRDDQQRYRDYLEKPLGCLKVGTITSPMISRMLSDIERTGKSGATVNQVRALASVVFSKGVEWGLASNNPVRNVKTRKKISRDRFLQAHELPRFFQALAEEPNAIIRGFFLLSLLTGARRANVLSMRWPDLNLDEGIWRISRTKNGDPQNLTLTAEAVALLTQLKNEADTGGDYVFPGEGKTGHLVEPKKGWQRIFDRDELTQLRTMIRDAGGIYDPLIYARTGERAAESLDSALECARLQAKELKLNIDGVRIKDVRIHDLRRTIGSWQAKTGASLAIIGKSLNHKSQQATAIYARLDLDPVRASLEKATSAMLGAAGITSLTPESARLQPDPKSPLGSCQRTGQQLIKDRNGHE